MRLPSLLSFPPPQLCRRETSTSVLAPLLTEDGGYRPSTTVCTDNRSFLLASATMVCPSRSLAVSVCVYTRGWG